jgi:hypothetical protein
MPAYLRGQPRDNLVFVKATTGTVFYGFKTKDLTSQSAVSQTDVDALGHVRLERLASDAIPVLGANAPKPPRVRKQIIRNPDRNQQGVISTFCAIDTVAAAQARGWEVISLETRVPVTNNDRTITAAALFLNGGLYMFPMNRDDFDLYGEELHLVPPHEYITGYFFKRYGFSGASKPKPPIVSKQTSQGTFTCFCSVEYLPEALEEHGYKLVKPEVKYASLNRPIFP